MKQENITMIVACAKNRTIGDDNKMLWHIPKDFKWFKEKTLGHTVIMGRKTMESILPYTKGEPLPGRKNIILSRSEQNLPGFTVMSSIDSILELSNHEEIMIIGGANVYEQFLPYAGKLIITEIQKDFDGEAKFPEFDKNDFNITFKQDDNQNGFDFSFVIYERKTSSLFDKTL